MWNKIYFGFIFDFLLYIWNVYNFKPIRVKLRLS